MEKHQIKSLDHYIQLWKSVYAEKGHTNWSEMLNYYHQDIVFKDSVQEIHGIEEFTAMTERLAKRSQNLKVIVHNATMDNNLIFVEWEMQIQYKKYPQSSVYGTCRISLKDGKIINQRDYYDLWGDIFDNIKFLRKGYRKFMRKRFG